MASDGENMTCCSMCSYYPKSKDSTQITWLMKRHYLSKQHTTSLRKKSGYNTIDLSDEGFLEYYEKRVPYVEDINVRETYLGYINHLKDRIAMRITLEKEGQKAGYITAN